eukprot:2892531-Rhodomonas_salina.2
MLESSASPVARPCYQHAVPSIWSRVAAVNATRQSTATGATQLPPKDNSKLGAVYFSTEKPIHSRRRMPLPAEKNSGGFLFSSVQRTTKVTSRTETGFSSARLPTI